MLLRARAVAGPERVWNRIPDGVRGQVVQLALDEPERECQQFCVRGRFDHHAAKNLSSKMMANWVFAATHSRGCIFHALAA